MAKSTFDATKPVNSGTDSSSDMRNNFNALYQGDISPLRARAQSTPDLTVAVAASVRESFFDQVYRSGQPVSFAGGNSPSISAPSANPRIDIVYLNAAGSLAVVTGSEAASPVPDWASLPDTAIAICLVYCKTTMDRILNYEDKDSDTTEGYIYKDVRPLILLADEVDLSSEVDDNTIKYSGGALKVADRIEQNTMLALFLIAKNDSMAQYGMTDGIVDGFINESGIDTSGSTNEDYDAVNDLYSPTTAGGGLDSYVVLLLHCNGTDTSTTFTDDSASAHTITANGDAQIDTAQKKFGTGAALFDGTGDYLSVPDHSDWDFGTGDFTVDFWMRWNGSVQQDDLISRNGTTVFKIYYYSGQLRVAYAGDNRLMTGWSPSADTWYHIAVTRDSGTLRAFIDGTQIGSDVTAAQDIQGSSEIQIGIDTGTGRGLNGWIDEVRISKGIARWTTDFSGSLPTAEYDAGTTNNMTLVSEDFTAEAQPTDARLVVYEEDVDSVTINTDLKAYVSRDGGTTYSELTLVDEGDYQSGKRILSALIDISGQPAGTTMKYKMVTDNNKDLNIHGVSLAWD